MTKYKFKDENNNWQELVQDVKVNGTSAFDGEVANIKLKTINYQDITGTGNIAISGGTSTDVQINGTSIVVNDVANILTESTYSSSNKIATVNDIPTDTGDLTNNAGFITGITSADVTTALGYTPYDSSNPEGYTSNVGTVTDVQINGTSIVTSNVANFLTETAYSSNNKIATISDIPTDTNELTNSAGFITSSDLSGYATETWVGNQGYITGIISTDVTTALGYTPYNATNPDGFITGITSTDVTTALGYTPYNSSNPSDYQENVIETVKVNGTTLTVTSKAVDITVPTDTNDLTNGAGFITGITSSDVTTALGYIPYDSSNPNGYTSNVGTVTDVQINGTSIVTSNVANFLTETAYNSSTNKIATVSDLPDISTKQDTLVSGTNIKTINSVSILGSGDIDTKSQDVTVLSGTSITLADNSIHTLTPSGNTTFTLPTVTDTTIFHQILVQLNMSTVYTINLGTTTYFGGTAPDLSATGHYNLIYEYDNALSAWVVGAVSKA